MPPKKDTKKDVKSSKPVKKDKPGSGGKAKKKVREFSI